MSAASGSAPAPASFSRVRVERLQEIESKVQKLWESNKVFEQDGPSGEVALKNKYLATFPYPYMNGILHLGHAFTFLKADFQVAYQRLKGKTALFPFGFHCTGMPIQAAADKLRKEIGKYGNPPNFPSNEVNTTTNDDEEESKDTNENNTPAENNNTDNTNNANGANPAPAAAAPKKRGGKSKVASKASTAVYQWNIMKEMGIPVNEIAKFTDPLHWLSYFPPIAIENLKNFGVCSDFRRSFITTHVNPYYNSFIEWQFNTLRKRDKIAFGNRPCIFSPIDNQACADHDRASGEGVGITEYTLIKLALQRPFPKALNQIISSRYSDEASINNLNVYLPAATLRPETMYGQTNAWMLPTGEYGVYLMADNSIFVCAPRSALNMSYQLMTASRGKVDLLGLIQGVEFMGSAVKAPNAIHPIVYVLPLLTIKMDKGTGVVTSVPSDAPDDYAALMDLKNKPDLRKKYNISDEHVLPFEVVPIIETPGLGTTPAKDLCISMKVSSQNDRVKLDEIKDKVYKEGFSKGIMLVGTYKGTKVSEAKPKLKSDMINQGVAAAYSEPESLVMSRSGNECVVAFTDQWYLKYGEVSWQELVRNHVTNTLDTFGDSSKEKFQQAVDWLHEWACSRSFGLGTFLPWDKQYVIESLSDSTIYMAYYTIAHLLQEGSLEGSKVGPAGIKPEQLTDDVYDFIFGLTSSPPSSTSIPVETLNRLRNEFHFWYPMDLRVSGKDLIANHLTMSLYNHTAIWPDQPSMWPRAFYANGHVMVEAEKMSKSKGNFIILPYAIKEWGADATRFALADAGDGLEDSNFEKSTANAAILRLTKEEAFVNEMKEFALDSAPVNEKLRRGPYSFWDQVFANDIAEAIKNTDLAYDRMKYRDALKAACYDFHIARDNYKLACKCVDTTMHADLVFEYIRVSTLLLSPICPHYCQEIWTSLGNTNFIHRAAWPSCATSFNVNLSREGSYVRKTAELLRSIKIDAYDTAIKLAKKQSKGGETPAAAPTGILFNACIVFVSPEYPAWQQTVLKILQKLFHSKGSNSSLPAAEIFEKTVVMNELKEAIKDKKLFAEAMKFYTSVLASFTLEGESALALTAPFNEVALAQSQSLYLSRGLDVNTFKVLSALEASSINIPGADPARFGPAAEKALPTKPTAYFFNTI